MTETVSPTSPYPADHAPATADAQTSATPASGTDTAIRSFAPQLLEAPGLVRRMACWLYEGMLLFGVVFIAGYLFGTLTQTRNALDNRHGLQAFVFLVFGIYFTWLWSRGQTLAMKTWHIRIVDKLGRPLGQLHALCRYLLAWVWILPPLAFIAPIRPSAGLIIFAALTWVVCWALASKLRADGQFWHDVWAGTRLVSSQPHSARASQKPQQP